MSVRILVGDVRERLKDIPDGSVQCVVTSPPYFGLRDYGTAAWDGGDPACDHREPGTDRGSRPELPNPPAGWAGRAIGTPYRATCGKCGAVRVDQQIGLEGSLSEYIDTLVSVFRDVRRVLHATGCAFINLGDSYAGSTQGGGPRTYVDGGTKRLEEQRSSQGHLKTPIPSGLKPKDLMMVPARVAIALQEPWERHVIPNLADRAWMAGLVDGEGCFTVQAVRVKGSINESHSVRLQVRMADVEAVERIVAITGLNQVTYDQLPPSYAANGQRPAQQWKISGDRMADIAADLYPYLTVKRRQALVAWNLQHLRDGQDVGRGKPVPEANMEKRRVLHDVMRRLNAREHVDIPSWCKEPEVITEPGWYLRSSIIWAKKNCMPESVTDRPTSSHEHIFLLTKQARYFFDAEAVKEAASEGMDLGLLRGRSFADGVNVAWHAPSIKQRQDAGVDSRTAGTGFRNIRNVWHLATEPFPEAHFATFPTEIPRRCIKAGTSERGQCPACGSPWKRVVERAVDFASGSGKAGNPPNGKNHGQPQTLSGEYDVRMGPVVSTTTTGWQPSCTCDAGEPVPQTVLDPFLGSGTTLMVADQLGRNGVGIELSEEYALMAENRIKDDAPMFVTVGVE